MKVALLTDWYLPRLGGHELHIRDLARELAARGCDPHVVTSTRAGLDEQGRGLPAVDLPPPGSVTVHRLDVPLLPRYRLAYTPGAFRELRRLLERERFDVVHAMVGVVSPVAIGGVGVAVRLGLPTVVTFHSMLAGLGHVLRALDLATAWSRWPLVLSGVSGVVADDVARLASGRSVRVLPNGLDAEHWRVEAVPGRRDELRVVSVMRLNPRKRGGALLRAFARARRELGGSPKLHLTVVGEGPDRRRLARLAERLGLDGAVTFAGYRSRTEIRDVLARSDVFVLASVLESFGIAALEARAAGIPVVARDAGGLKEMVGHGRDGLLASSDAELAGHLVLLARDRSMLEALAAGARETPVPVTWADTVERHLSAYRDAVEAWEPGVEPAGTPEAARVRSRFSRRRRCRSPGAPPGAPLPAGGPPPAPRRAAGSPPARGT